jgi:signal transduction histidine kinase
MNTFDTRTAFLMIGLLYLLLPSIAWLTLVGQRSRQIDLWCGGGLLVGGAMILTSLDGIIPTWACLYLPAMMVVVSHLARIHSLRLDLGIPWRVRWMVLAGGVFILIFVGLDSGLQNPFLRAEFNSLVGAGLLFFIATLAWRIGREEHSRNAIWFGSVYGLVAVSLLFRAYTLLNGKSTVINLLDEGFSGILIALSVVFSSVVGHFCYVGLALDRSMRRELKIATERARDEVSHRLGEQIAHLERQRSLGELSASLGHELNQPLTAILTNAQVAKRRLQTSRFDTAPLNEFLDKIVFNSRRASHIIDRIRGFIRPSASHTEPINLHKIVRGVVELVADEARRCKVAFIFPSHTHTHLILVNGDSIHLSQIVLNVFRNAIEALTQVARREIQVSCHRVEDRAILRIRDTGPGMTPETLSQVGTPFFTTKSTGLGLGISIARSIAKQLGGTLTLANAEAHEGGGAIIELNLPALPEAKSWQNPPRPVSR